MNTAHGALWATELGTLPSARRTPAMPLLPTTITSAFSRSATRTMASAGSPVSAWPSTVDPRRPGPGAVVVEHGVGLAAGAQVLTEFLGDPRGPHRLGLVGRDDVELGPAQLGQVDGAVHGLGRGVRAVCADHHRREHGHPSSPPRALYVTQVVSPQLCAGCER